MISKERLIEIINNLVAWGIDHEEEFYDCLMDAADMTDEELAELGLVYDYDGDEIKSLVRLQKKLEKEKTKITSPSKVLAFCKENNIDTNAAFLAGACECAFHNIKEKKGNKNPLDFDVFCSTCEEIWLDWDELNPGLTTIADYVVDYYNEHHKLPKNVFDLDI